MLLAHRYGADLTLYDDPYLLTLLARIGAPETTTDVLPPLVRAAYSRLFGNLLAREFPTLQDRVQTRMAATDPRAFYEGPRLCPQTPLVLCAVIRAGILPSQACYEAAVDVLPPANVRLDFINMSRVLDEEGHVVGVRMDGSKIGGPVDDAIVVVPDPMGATGSTVVRVVETYRNLSAGAPRAIVALHLMVTPEAIRRVQHDCPGTRIHAARLDRGLSPRAVLGTVPGTQPELERGLNDVHYIVPGAGGMGELLTNSWV